VTKHHTALTALLVDANGGNWTFRPFVNSPHWTYSTFPQRFLLIQLKPKHVFRRGAHIGAAMHAVQCFMTGGSKNRIHEIHQNLRNPVSINLY